ncbi:Uncharacterized protein OS=Isosphaera pallida (strain ATCC 43644 / DSM 9630 / IS1B) GN=Isop_1004 PE=4 SV=1 [Gemmata massiliana]|uniref:Uncharacterized protein n=1 Tax=Gemmata massiliana TaxID=1210884 RepID=A0A6P2D8Z8_9BACT|nr:hypothetical protein [Gemmata massiliana]VTR97688.1 Uncharacterized protein OS=Isosphaera pallida (strain ATCC 43644 / DSM 9630 / IS1B) GN=Isop_1004 PE=4 SV=1 [Gemmata massiliana]
MEVRDALDQLDRIHDQLTKSEVYRGFRVPTVAMVGALGLLAAVGQRWVVPDGEPRAFVWYWSIVGGIGTLLGFGAAIRSYLFREDDFERRRTRRVMGQFLPCVLAGALLTVAFARTDGFVPLLPGMWAIVFGLGVVSVRPHLPRAVGLIGIVYVLTGGLLLAWLPPEPSGWCVGGVFGIGHLVTALALQSTKEYHDD